MNKFDDVFCFMADAMCHSFEKGFLEFNTDYKSGSAIGDFLKFGFSLMEDGANVYFDFALELEFWKTVRSESLSTDDFSELFLLKQLIICIRNQSVNEFVDIMSHMCSSEPRGYIMQRFIDTCSYA
jgi:hypothetical protein